MCSILVLPLMSDVVTVGSSIWSAVSSPPSITKLQVMQKATLRTDT